VYHKQAALPRRCKRRDTRSGENYRTGAKFAGRRSDDDNADDSQGGEARVIAQHSEESPVVPVIIGFRQDTHITQHTEKRL
jgi:hypothetical protein